MTLICVVAAGITSTTCSPAQVSPAAAWAVWVTRPNELTERRAASAAIATLRERIPTVLSLNSVRWNRAFHRETTVPRCCPGLDRPFGCNMSTSGLVSVLTNPCGAKGILISRTVHRRPRNAHGRVGGWRGRNRTTACRRPSGGDHGHFAPATAPTAHHSQPRRRAPARRRASAHPARRARLGEPRARCRDLPLRRRRRKPHRRRPRHPRLRRLDRRADVSATTTERWLILPGWALAFVG